MKSPFFEVFPELKVNEKLHDLFADTQVEKVTTDSNRDFVRVHVVSSHLLPKRDVYDMEDCLTRMISAKRAPKMQIIERFTLPETYTPEKILEEYRDSLLLELSRDSAVLASVFADAKISFAEENILCMELADSMVAQQKKEALIEFLEQVYARRFGRPIQVRVVYQVPEESKLKQGQLQFQQQVDEIRRQREETKAAEAAQAGNGKGKKAKTQGHLSPADPTAELIYGRPFTDSCIPLSQVVSEMGEITFRGQIITFETRQIKNEKTILQFAVTDFTDTITVKMFVKNDRLTDLLARLKEGMFVKVKGVTTIDKYDGELTIGSVSGLYRIEDFRDARKDNAPEKRVELHCHTKMSEMDGVSDVRDIVKRAHDWGQKAIAITDHGVVQAFTDAWHYQQTLDKEDPFKVIYGMEGYLVDDLQDIAVHEKGQSLEGTCVVFDLETTGLSSIKDRIIEIGAVKVDHGRITDRFSTFVNPKRPLTKEITKLTSITDGMLKDAPDIETVLPEFLNFIGDAVLVAHNADFDMGFIEQNMRYQDRTPDFTYVDTVALSRILLPDLSKYRLDTVARALGVSLENHHRAVDDAAATAEIFIKFIDMLKEQGIRDLTRLNQLGISNVNQIRKLRTNHVIILAKNQTGRVNLYQLVSASHLDYYSRVPRIPKSELSRHREGLLIGSACQAGELFQALLDEEPPEKISRIVRFYDYLEIQPIANNRFMIENSHYPNVSSEEDLQELNRQIVKLGEQYHKPVAATCDVHFLDPEDEIYRRIIMNGKGFSDADHQAPLYLRTTEEMLEEFSYLGEEKAREVVIENPNQIADQIEKISPVRPDNCPPVIPDSDKILRESCYEKAHAMYGDPLPQIVTDRLERELTSIISNGFAVLYIIAQRLVKKSNEDGYLVGSRGSVGSSFVATMAGITEVNPLSPHYYCKKCHYSDFDSPEVKAYAGGCGWDMPDKVCPVCGEPLTKDGFDIPFETFLGFEGNKEPDIDLNFSGDYQSTAHKYTEVIFGTGQTFRAGTIATMADKTAYGYVKNYFLERGEHKRSCEIDRIVQGCVGIRRSTGQHPGGIIVLPHGEDINTFTPVQHPANDMNTDIVTTHFDYHSIDHNLLKLDILGHDDPTMIRALEEYITSPELENEYNEAHPFDATKIPLDDAGVLSLFHDTSALGIRPEDIGGVPVGILGIPEFGTEFVIGLVRDTKPKNLSDLIRISGLSHGTDVWQNNAQDLIKSGTATLSTAICTRDDIMLYLISKGLDSEESFTIMERVRKGAVAKGKCKEWPKYRKDMAEKGVPDWYMDSCEKIKYMFPKAHAAAYVMMAYRIAYCKINYPLAYYAAYFGIRAKAFSYELMCQGPEELNRNIEDYTKRSASLTNREQDALKDMAVVREMYARGLEFLPIDIYQAQAKKFRIMDGKLMPPLDSIRDMGEKAAEAVEAAAKDGPFLSRDDFQDRTKVSRTVVDHMAELGLLGDIPESNQLSLFEML